MGEDLAEAKTTAFQYGVELATAAAIERCAQVADKLPYSEDARNIATAIRALKDKP